MIKFGTDGWRAVIGEEFTYANVRRVAKAHGEVLRERGLRSAVVGAIGRSMHHTNGLFRGQVHGI